MPTEGNVYYKYVFMNGTDKNEREREREWWISENENKIFHLAMEFLINKFAFNAQRQRK